MPNIGTTWLKDYKFQQLEGDNLPKRKKKQAKNYYLKVFFGACCRIILSNYVIKHNNPFKKMSFFARIVNL